METNKTLGIWMDHSTAHLIDIDTEIERRPITSNFLRSTKEEALNRSENIMHNKRQQMHEVFYKEIADEILKYNHVLLFGPTNAKTELHNYLKMDVHFKDIKIDIEPADKLSENKKYAFVKKHFKK